MFEFIAAVNLAYGTWLVLHRPSLPQTDWSFLKSICTTILASFYSLHSNVLAPRCSSSSGCQQHLPRWVRPHVSLASLGSLTSSAPSRFLGVQKLIGKVASATMVEEKFPKENFRVNREMRDEILVYDLFLTKFWAKMASKCRGNAAKILILGFRF